MKGQVESMGLVIIVVLVIFLFLFAFVFMTKEEVKSNSFLSVKADNFMNAVTQVKIHGKNIEEQAASCCESSCEAFGDEMEKVLGLSVEEGYAFSVSKEGNLCKEIGQCINGIASSSYRLRSSDEKYELKVVLC